MGTDVHWTSRWTPLLLALCLLLALALRLPGLTDPWSGKGFNSLLAAFSTGEFAQNFIDNGFFEAGFMPNRWRVELADGTVVREWYAHHPVAYALISAFSLKLFGGEGGGEWCLRLPWLLISVAAVWALYRFLALVWGERVGLLGAFFMAVLPLAAHYSVMTWVDPNAMPLVYVLFLRRYVLWLRAPGPETLRPCAIWAFLGGMLDWNIIFLLAFVLVHAAVSLWQRERSWRSLVPLLWIPFGVACAVAVHGAHVLAVVGLDEMMGETSATWERTTTNTHPWMELASNQWSHVSDTLTPAVAGVLVLGLLRQLVLGCTGRLTREEWLWPVLLLPGFAYVTVFPFRGMNHKFMIALSLPWFAATLALEVLWLGRLSSSVRWLRVGVPALLTLALAYFSVDRVHGMWRDNRSEAVSLVAQQDWFQSRFSDPRAVCVTSRGQTWTLSYYARTPFVSRIISVAQLEDLREAVLSRLEPERPVYFLFDRQYQDVERELHGYLKAAAPPEEHLEGLQADPLLVFDVFDITEWAHAGDGQD